MSNPLPLPNLDELARLAGGVFVSKLDWEEYRTSNEDPRFHPLMVFGNNWNYLEALRRTPSVTPSIPEIRFSFVDDQTVNAWASPNKIVIHLGAYFVLRCLFHRCLAHPDVLKDVLPNDQERAPEPMSRLPFSVDSCPPKQISPVNRDRLIAANCMIEFAFTFLTAHEFAHIRNGHLGFLAEQMQNLGNSISEQAKAVSMLAASAEQDALYGRWLRALEYDADCYAINHIMLRVFDGPDNLAALPGVFATAFQEVETRLRLYSFAIHVMYRIFWAANPSASIDNPDHPTPPVRAALFHATSAAWMMASPSVGEHTPKYMEHLLTGLREAELAIDLIVGGPGSHSSTFRPLLEDVMLDSFNGPGVELRALEEDWRQIRQRVALHCYCTNLP